MKVRGSNVAVHRCRGREVGKRRGEAGTLFILEVGWEVCDLQEADSAGQLVFIRSADLVSFVFGRWRWTKITEAIVKEPFLIPAILHRRP